MFVGLLISAVSASNHTKCSSLSDQKCMTQPTLTNFQCNEYSQELNYYALAVNLDGSVRSGNTFNDLSNKVFVPNKTEDLKLSFFNIITGIKQSTILTKHV